MEKIIKILKEKNKTISCMESCTGGLFSSELTNIDGSSDAFKLGLVTYSNEYKEYFGVSKKVIEEYTVYSTETAKEMAYNACRIANSDYSVGITGMLGKLDPYNKSDKINEVYISIYVEKKNKYHNYKIEPIGKTRAEKKEFIVNFIKERLYGICK